MLGIEVFCCCGGDEGGFERFVGVVVGAHAADDTHVGGDADLCVKNGRMALSVRCGGRMRSRVRPCHVLVLLE
jgi:hypothetical protein